MAGAMLDHDWYSEPLPENVFIGERSWLYSSFAFLHYQSRKSPGVQIGHDTGIYAGTFFDLGPEGEVIIGNYSSLVGAIIASNTRIAIGDYVFIAHEVVIADLAAAVPGQLKEVSKSIEIGSNVWIGANAILLAGAYIGEGAVIGAAAVVDFDVPPYSLVAGNPGKILKNLRK